MKNESIKKINVAGLIGYIASILLIVVSITAMVITTISTVAAITVAKEDVGVNIASEYEINATGDILEKLNHFIGVKGIDNLTDLESEAGEEVALEDNDISSIKVTNSENGFVINAKAKEVHFSIKNLIAALVVSFCTLGAVTVALEMVKSLMKALKSCETPFSQEVVRRMARFANSLIPAAVLGMVCEGVWSSLSSGTGFEMSLNIGSVLLVAVVYMLVIVFKYGAELQRESDETL